MFVCLQRNRQRPSFKWANPILSPKSATVKKGEAKLLNELKVVWNHCDAKKKRYTSKAV